jgi:hypothetical protein
MRGEFSENSNRLLKDSLTMESLGFMREIAVPERGGLAATVRLNSMFTMTARRNGATRQRMRRP